MAQVMNDSPGPSALSESHPTRLRELLWAPLLDDVGRTLFALGMPRLYLFPAGRMIATWPSRRSYGTSVWSLPDRVSEKQWTVLDFLFAPLTVSQRPARCTV